MRFKTRKKNNHSIKIYILMIVISFILTYNYLDYLKNLKINNNLLMDLSTNNYELKFKDKVKSLLYMGLNYNVGNEETKLKILTNKKNDSKPLIYIYNTHQSEEYDSKMLNAYNISYTVETASYILKDYLNKYGINSFVEKESIASYLNSNNLSYKDSYKASRYYINKRLNEDKSINYIIDIHRDSLPKDKTTTVINGKSFAKILFVIGLDNKNYVYNLDLANKINSKIDKSITRGILKKGGRSSNGIYNQDLSKNALLIEIGGSENTIEEVNNSIVVLARAINESIDKNE